MTSLSSYSLLPYLGHFLVAQKPVTDQTEIRLQNDADDGVRGPSLHYAASDLGGLHSRFLSQSCDVSTTLLRHAQRSGRLWAVSPYGAVL